MLQHNQNILNILIRREMSVEQQYLYLLSWRCIKIFSLVDASVIKVIPFKPLSSNKPIIVGHYDDNIYFTQEVVGRTNLYRISVIYNYEASQPIVLIKEDLVSAYIYLHLLIYNPLSRSTGNASLDSTKWLVVDLRNGTKVREFEDTGKYYQLYDRFLCGARGLCHDVTTGLITSFTGQYLGLVIQANQTVMISENSNSEIVATNVVTGEIINSSNTPTTQHTVMTSMVTEAFPNRKSQKIYIHHQSSSCRLPSSIVFYNPETMEDQGQVVKSMSSISRLTLDETNQQLIYIESTSGFSGLIFQSLQDLTSFRRLPFESTETFIVF
jgi:hypothetical protein